MDPSRRGGREAIIVRKEIGNFSLDRSLAWQEIQSRFSSGITHQELLGIARVLSQMASTPNITRTCMRSFKALIKWFDDNWSEISPYIHNVSLLDTNNELIDSEREAREKADRR